MTCVTNIRYVLVSGPYDHTFVGPFDDEAAANEYADDINKLHDFGCTVMTIVEMGKNIKEYGPCPVQKPE